MQRLATFPLVLLLAGCGPHSPRPKLPIAALTFTDGAGRIVTSPKEPKRIVTLAAAATEILYAMGCGDRIVGVDRLSDHPEEVKAKPRVGTGARPSIETIIGLAPDLVVTWWFHREAIQALENKGLTVVSINPNSVAQVMKTIQMLGLVTRRTDAAERLSTKMQARIDVIKTKIKPIPATARPRVYFELLERGKTVGPGTFTGDLITLAGGINIATGETVRYPILSQETVIARDPEVIIIIGGGRGAAEIQRRRGWRGIAALRSGRVFTIDTHLVTASPRIVMGLEKLARWFHPGLGE